MGTQGPGESENKKTVLPQICRGLVGEVPKLDHSLPGKTLCPAEVVAIEESIHCQGCIQGGRWKTMSKCLVSPCSCPCSQQHSHWLKLHVGWLRGGAQKIVGQTSWRNVRVLNVICVHTLIFSCL